MDYLKTPQKHMTNQKPIKVISKKNKFASKNTRIILF